MTPGCMQLGQWLHLSGPSLALGIGRGHESTDLDDLVGMKWTESGQHTGQASLSVGAWQHSSAAVWREAGVECLSKRVCACGLSLLCGLEEFV